MKTILTTLLLALLFTLNAQSSLTFSRVKINLQTCSPQQIAVLGLEVDHGDYAPGKHLINDYSSDEIATLTANNIDHQILIQDVKQWYVDQNKPGNEHYHDHKTGTCGSGSGGSYPYNTPVNYQYGSMGGYLTYSELLIELDKMTALYPNLISPKTPISNTILTHEGLPIYYLRISDNPNTDEPEPEALYTALHHAREPNSLAQMIFYMWYLLENYSTDTEIQYLLNETELYFVPCVNPDGYIYNEQTDPNGGGMWRKNRKSDPNGSVHGVDLNRNYGHEWGYDNNGSSPNSGSQTYRGDSPFSEPETQNLKLFCEAHQFQIALNYHCYGNLLIYPWGYNDQPTGDHQTFLGMSAAMTRENNFFAGSATQTVGYSANGVSDDWMYGEMTTKPAIFSMTPEVGPGSYGFWPPQSAIDELNKSCLKQNLVTAHLLLNYGATRETNPQPSITSLNGDIELEVEKLGLQNGTLTLEILPLTSNITMNTGSQTLNLAPWSVNPYTFSYTLDNTTMNGDSAVFVVELSNGLYTFTDTIVRVFGGNLVPVYTEDGNNISEWQITSAWGQTNEDYNSPALSITDSPYANYSKGQQNYITLNTAIDLTNAVSAEATFFAKWEIESDYDYVQFQAAPVGGSYTALCGFYTETGQNTQPQEPVFDGNQQSWVQERISLDDYIGGFAQFRFVFVSDNSVRDDGFYFDDFVIQIEEPPVSTNTEELTDPSLQLILQPNPANDVLTFATEHQKDENANITVYNGLGQVVYRQAYTEFVQEQIDIANWAAGLYFVELKADQQSIVEKLIVH